MKARIENDISMVTFLEQLAGQVLGEKMPAMMESEKWWLGINSDPCQSQI